ncbi:PDR/VanB family oxidoreductase [Derxia gummosa]|uniref:PDR/VanB family oxidoreductase n=1 Tax=Derxia gummosa DSM 723 TaxID=1121388 RepID=A0A8B6X4G6_9BURK|nr:PDR/VanB family oxidoreductase [Derxia gummosa]
MTPDVIDLVVARSSLQGQGVLVVDLADPAGAALPAFEAGAHIDLHLGPDLVRQYSLAGDPADRRIWRLGILRDPASRGGSIAAHEQLREGARVRAGLPRNLFPLAADGAALLVGGGIGVTPMIAMAHALHAAGRDFALHYCGRSRAGCAFVDELAAAPFAARVHLHFDDERGATGPLDAAALFGAAPAGGHVYTCGPEGFMTWVLDSARAAGIPEARLHQEHFQATAEAGGRPFEVVAKRSGRTVTVGAGETLVAALARIGIRVQVSCEQGICGTCMCDVLEGRPDHRDAFLTDEERDSNELIIACRSRALDDRLVLDV